MPVAVANETHDLPIALFPYFPPLSGDFVNREPLAVTGLLELFGKHDWNLFHCTLLHARGRDRL